MKKIFNIAIIAAMVLSLTGCEDFLNRPTIDNYSTGNYYQNDEQCVMGVNYLYNSPWYDFVRGFLAVGDCMAGNYHDDQYGFLQLSPQASGDYATNMSKSLWSVNGHCSTVIENIVASQGPSSAVKRQTIGEALVWKAVAYFYLVRVYGEVPIIHKPADMINSGDYNTVYRNTKENLYDYILMILETAETLLPKNATPNGRVDYWSARALEAKVYLTMAGVSGQLNQDYLKKAFEISKDVIENSGRHLMTDYAAIFYGENNISEEALISWMWSGKTTEASGWTAQNSFQNDLAFGEMGQMKDNWGAWKGAQVNLQEVFGVTALDNPATRADIDKDARRKATYMLPGDVYPQFWRTVGGLDVLKAVFDKDYARFGCPESWGSNTGTFVCVKHCFGDNDDHMAMFGYAPARNMTSAIATHILRLGDIYLVNAEAAVLGGGDIAYGCARLNDVRRRSIKDYKAVNGYTFDDVWVERRKELAMEGDRWYDYVRVSYYNPEYALNNPIDGLKIQKRGDYWNKDNTYKAFYESYKGNENNKAAWVWNLVAEDGSEFHYPTNEERAQPQAYQTSLSKDVFRMPITADDVIFNGNLASDVEPISENVREKYTYDFSNL